MNIRSFSRRTALKAASGVVALAVLAFGTGSVSAEPVTIAKIKESGVLRVGVEATYPPFTYRDKGEFVGYDMDILALFAKELGSDNMHGDMVEVMRWGLSIGRLQEGKVSDFWQPEDVFEMATLGGAKAMGLDADLGSLTVGKKADAVLFDFHQVHLTPATDPLGNLVHVGQGRDVDTVLVDGKVVVAGGRATLVDQDKIIADGAKAAADLWSRARAEV